MIPRIILSRSFVQKSLAAGRHIKEVSSCGFFRPLAISMQPEIIFTVSQNRNFSISTSRKGLFDFFGKKIEVSNETAEKLIQFGDTQEVGSSSPQAMITQSLDDSAISSNIDPPVLGDNFTPNVESTPFGENISTLDSIPDAATFADLGLGGSILPHRLFQDILEYLHTTAGLEWIPAIAILTIILRTLTIPCVASMRAFSARTMNLYPESLKIQQMMQKATAERNQILKKKTQMEYQTFLQKNNINPFKALFFNLPNMVIFSSMFFGLRQMCNAQVPSLIDGGMLWFTNLTVADPYMILPVVSCLSMSALIVTGAADSELGPAGGVKGFRKFLVWMPIISIPFLIFQPSLMFAFWIASNTFTFALLALFRNKAVREFFSIPELVKHGVAMDAQFQSMVNPFDVYKKVKKQQLEAKQLMKKVENYKKEMEKLKTMQNKEKQK